MGVLVVILRVLVGQEVLAWDGICAAVVEGDDGVTLLCERMNVIGGVSDVDDHELV